MTTEGRPKALGGLSVRTRITVSVAVLVGLALAGAGLVVFALESARIERDVADRVEQHLAKFTQLRDRGIDPPVAGGRRRGFDDVTTLVETYLGSTVTDTEELMVGYWDGAARVVSTETRDAIVRDPEFLRIVDARLTSGGTERMESDWGEVVVTVQPVQDETRSGALVIASFLAADRRELDQVMQTYAIVSALSLGLVTAAASWQAGRLLKPLRVLRQTADEITATDLSGRIPEEGNDDITALSRTFNEMLARLEAAFTGQRRFLDDAGHELKTPLTVIRGHVELLDGNEPDDIDATRVLLLDEVDRMARLVGDLTVLAKADRPDFLQPGAVDVGPFTRTVLDKCRALGDRTWVLDGAADVSAWVDEQRLTQAVLELAQNAVKHTRPGDEIGLGSGLDPGHDTGHGLVMWVRDTGPGVPDQDKGLVFERFGRSVVPAGDEGFGLGLSIVRAIATAHGGTVHVEDVVPHGARFVLSLPVRRKDEPWHAS